MLNIEVRRGEAVAGSRIPIVERPTNKDVLLADAARKNAIDESPIRRESMRGAENPRRRETKSIRGVKRRPEVPADEMIDLANGVPLNSRTKIKRRNTP